MDYDTGDIKSVRPNGSNLTQIHKTGSNGNYDLALNGDNIYCTNNFQILKLRKHPETTSKIVHTEKNKILSLIVFAGNGKYF